MFLIAPLKRKTLLKKKSTQDGISAKIQPGPASCREGKKIIFMI
jgi:hypothetical protein